MTDNTTTANLTREYIDFAHAARRSPGKPHISSVWRWARHGVKTRSGQTVRLRHVRAGRKCFTTPQWLGQFFADIAAQDQEHFDEVGAAQSVPTTTTTHTRSDAQRQRDIALAEAELDAAGI